MNDQSKATTANDPSESLPTEVEAQDQASESAEDARGARTDGPAKRGMPGSVNDSRRCTATANRTGERCRAPAILGSTVCRVHGGAAPQTRKAAKERLLELVDPALAALHKILVDPKVDDATKVRASVAVLDRTGFRPGVVVEVDPGDRWSELLAEAVMVDNRSIGSPPSERGEIDHHNAVQLALDARTEAWRDYNNEDQAEFERGRIRPDENTVVGSVVVGRYDIRDDLGPTDPPRYAPADPPEDA